MNIFNIFSLQKKKNIINYTYINHLFIIINIYLHLFIYFIKNLIHSFFPIFFQNSSLDCVNELHHFIKIYFK